MAQVAGGLVRTSSSTPPPDESNGYSFHMHAMGSPPGDYVCKLCATPGHWLKDCQLYEQRGAVPHPSKLCALRNPSASQTPTGITGGISKFLNPPGNYVCRLCGVPGHWIEQCSRFQPRKDLPKGPGHSIPPKNYICNLCHQPGHWIQHCIEFTPRPNPHVSHRTRSLSGERPGRYF